MPFLVLQHEDGEALKPIPKLSFFFFNYLIIKKNNRAINGGLGVSVIVIHWFLCKVKNSFNKGET